jgi:hypothetical protein
MLIASVGAAVGAGLGLGVGDAVGTGVGDAVGTGVGAEVGAAVGAAVGDAAGAGVAGAVGAGVRVGAGVVNGPPTGAERRGEAVGDGDDDGELAGLDDAFGGWRTESGDGPKNDGAMSWILESRPPRNGIFVIGGSSGRTADALTPRMASMSA